MDKWNTRATIKNTTFMSTFFDKTKDGKRKFSYRMKNASNYCIYVKYIKSIPVGYIGLLEVQNPHYHGVWIDLIAVSKQYNNQNIAQNMIKSIVEKFNNKGINLFTALVKETNKPSLKVFEKNQFKGESACFKLLCLEKK